MKKFILFSVLVFTIACKNSEQENNIDLVDNQPEMEIFTNGSIDVSYNVQRQSDTEVMLELSFRETFEIIGVEQVINGDNESAVIFQVIESPNGVSNHQQVLNLGREVSQFRVYFWIDDVKDSLKEEVDCFKACFNTHRLDENLPIGNFDLNACCNGNKKPRQGSNGGVLGIR